MVVLTEEQAKKLFISGIKAGRKGSGFHIFTDEEKEEAFKDAVTKIYGEYPEFNINDLTEEHYEN